jgi:predicted Zn-dependent protease
MLTTLARLDEASGSRKGVPNWLSTHPVPADRVEHVQEIVRKIGMTPAAGSGERDRTEFLRRVDGLIYGDNPEEGIVRGTEFLHADLRFALTFPRGWDVQNSAQQVVAKAPGADAYVLLQIVPQTQGSIEQIAVGGMQNAGFRAVSGSRTEVNGLDAFVGTYQGNMQGIGNSTVRAAHIAHEKRVYLVAGVAAQQLFPRMEDELNRAVGSFRPLSRQDAAGIQPNRVDLYTVRPGDTWQSIASRASDGTVKPSTLAIMNHYEPDRPPPTGARIKIVVGG